MESSSIFRALGGGALIGLAASVALVAHGRIAGISGTLGRALDGDGGRRFRLAFLAGLIATGAIAARVAPAAIGAPVRGMVGLAIAGVLVGVGTTLANGCTSGHGVCGISRGSMRSLIAVVVFMVVAAIAVAVRP
jgi:uncharacterized membrane protein YedE/YeeE